MAKKSKFGADTVLEKHLGQSALVAHGGSDYFIPQRQFYDGSLNPIFGNLTVHGSTIHVYNSAVNGTAELSVENDARRYSIGVSGSLSDSFIIYDNTAPGTRFVIDSSGKVGIGTDSPASSALITIDGFVRIRQAGSSRYRSDHFVDSGTATINAYDDTGTVYIPLRIDGNDLILNNTSGGDVGIGTASPGAKLDVNGTLTVSGITSIEATNGIVQLAYDGASIYGISLKNISDGGWARGYQFANSSGTRLACFGATGSTSLSYAFIADSSASYTSPWVTFLPTGNVGIGTTTPGEKLDIEGSTTEDVFARVIGAANTEDKGAGLKLFENVNVDSAPCGFDIWLNSLTNDLYIRSYSNSLTPVNRVAIDRDNGNVGINTISPAEKLDVDGKARIQSLKTAQSHPTNYKAVYVDTDTGELYRIA